MRDEPSTQSLTEEYVPSALLAYCWPRMLRCQACP
jgi:hypothetical protein